MSADRAFPSGILAASGMVAAALFILEKRRGIARLVPDPAEPHLTPIHTCSFCGNTSDKVKVIAGPSVFICYECVGLCKDIVEELPYTTRKVLSPIIGTSESQEAGW